MSHPNAKQIVDKRVTKPNADDGENDPCIALCGGNCLPSWELISKQKGTVHAVTGERRRKKERNITNMKVYMVANKIKTKHNFLIMNSLSASTVSTQVRKIYLMPETRKRKVSSG